MIEIAGWLLAGLCLLAVVHPVIWPRDPDEPVGHRILGAIILALILGAVFWVST